LLYRSIAYPLSTNPLYIGREIESGKSGVRIQGQIGGVSRRHCSVELRGRDVVLKDFSTYGTFVDENRINGSAVLKLGQIIRVGTPGEELQLIACFDHDET
jgi:pSer/pThr/pTyr-binding forkhead associated (FHA) protein